jgi:hypothetical protein
MLLLSDILMLSHITSTYSNRGLTNVFADDTSLYLIVDDPNETADSLNNDLTKIHDWATQL